MANRVFQDVDPMTIKQPAPLAIGLYGYGGAGKTESALRIATGIARVYGGDVVFVDTENRKGLVYRDMFKFRYVPFDPPHNALDYAAAIQQYATRGGCVLVIDQMTEEHEGEGGLLDTHEKEKGDSASKTASAWAVAKRQHQKLARALRRALASIPIVATWRAQDKTDWNNRENGKVTPIPVGEMPIGSRDLPFEMTAHYLLRPGAHGVPCLNPETKGEKIMTKDPRWFQDVVKPGEPFSEAHGEAFARWAKGSSNGGNGSAKPAGEAYASATTAIAKASTEDGLAKVKAKIEGAKSLSAEEKIALLSAVEQRGRVLRGEGEPPTPQPEPVGRQPGDD